MVLQHGFTPLHVAAEGGFVDVVRLLVEKGTTLDAKVKVRRTTLILFFSVYIIFSKLFYCRNFAVC